MRSLRDLYKGLVGIRMEMEKAVKQEAARPQCQLPAEGEQKVVVVVSSQSASQNASP